MGLDLNYAGRQSESEAALKKVLELRPEFTGAHVALGRVYLSQSRPKEALEEMLKEKEPVFRLCGAPLAYYALGRKAESDSALADLIARFHNEAAFQIAEVYSYRGEVDKAFAWLERANTQHDGGLSELKGDPLLQPLEQDPRYPVFLKKIGLEKRN